MNIQTVAVLFVISYYIKYTFTLIFNKNKRLSIKQKNKTLNVLRQKTIKTIEEQKAFLDIKYPKHDPNWKFKITWKKTFVFIYTIIIYITIYKIIKYIFQYYLIEFTILQAILFIILFPLTINYIYSKFELEGNQVSAIIK